MASERPVLMIPGPIEYSDAVLEANALHGTSHVDPSFIKTFGDTLKQVRDVFLADDGQPFVVAGSGSLGWDMITANCTLPGDHAVIVNTGYFGDRWGDVFAAYGVTSSHVRGEVGGVPSVEAIDAALKAAVAEGRTVRIVTITHVDTSTGVRTDIKSIVQAVRAVVPDAIVACDGVCALAAEELRMKEWDVDAYLTGSQKAIGVPPGLSLVVARPRAIAAYEANLAKSGDGGIRNYYCSWQKWIPIMQSYEAYKPCYFATPAVNLINALHASLNEVLAGGMDKCFADHKATADTFRSAMSDLGLKLVPVSEGIAANTMSAVRYPSGVEATKLLPAIKKHGAIVAGGLHKDIKSEYFRVGHMGVTARQADKAYVNRTIAAVRAALEDCGYSK
eukprot:CAMPEP_0114631822 /NCGR_PEP_ID=MMETSP0168-20121206/14613_1 /TAXON_ID=95228 ORGANISM="Vannella sp., Strain DIVA3 517/6/12" /NCGR_SAMPLE_ID=MMETSP0168 /ASSEMBLY_ACC=CAM_ASM_000044 /LENGTH=390 /DNA_ID=CAMNT_0001843405 /DNA_START=1 /DNA_END=1173 /DNA_ORIENTATION=-